MVEFLQDGIEREMYLIRANANEIDRIVDMSRKAFGTDVSVGGAEGDCPPDFDSVEWHNQMAQEGHLYQAMIGEKSLEQPFYSRMKLEIEFTSAGFLLTAIIIEKAAVFA